jgi:hypothetical protein
MTRPIFNSYDMNDQRMTITGCRSTKMQDDAILYNLRHTWGEQVAHLSDAELVNTYDEFAASDWFGNNDERFMEWVKA